MLAVPMPTVVTQSQIAYEYHSDRVQGKEKGKSKAKGMQSVQGMQWAQRMVVAAVVGIAVGTVALHTVLDSTAILVSSVVWYRDCDSYLIHCFHFHCCCSPSHSSIDWHYPSRCD